VRDTPIDRVIRKSLSAEVRRTKDNHCVDDNLMAGYLESNLSPEETIAFESHVAGCAVCQEILAVSLKLGSREDGNPLPDESVSSKKTLFRFSIPIPAIGALLLCVAIGALFFHMMNRSEETPVKEVAELRSTEAPQAPPPTSVLERFSKDIPSTAPQELKTKDVGRLSDAIAARSAAGAAPMNVEKRGKIETVEADKPSAGMREEKSIPAAAPPAMGQSASVSPAGDFSKGVNGSPKEKKETAGIAVADATGAPAPQESKANVPAAARGGDLAAVAPASVQPSPSLPVGAVSATRQKELDLAGPMAADSSDAIAPARTQEPFSRPHIYAAQNRIATSLYTTESVESSLRFAIKNLNSNLKTAESRSIGDRVFYKNHGYWIDKDCAENADDQIVEIKSADPDYSPIAKKYPGIRSLLPAVIHWEKKNYLLR